MTQDADIFISGGGVAGLTAAATFGAAGFSVIAADPARPVTEETAEGADLRTTAFLQPARRLLEAAGIWEHYAPHATPLRVMRIVDAGGAEPVARSSRDFDSADLGEAPFGWNLPNWLLRRELLTRIAALDTVDFRPRRAFPPCSPRERRAVTPDRAAAALRCALADQRGWPRQPRAQASGMAGAWRYGQKAITSRHPAVPARNVHGNPPARRALHPRAAAGPRRTSLLSAVVWMVPGAEAQRLTALDRGIRGARPARRASSARLTLASRRLSWPITPASPTDERAASGLMAEGPHVVPPIGAQGLNMSLADLGHAAGAGPGHPPTGLGAPVMLDTYHRRRHPDVRLRVRWG